MGHHLLTIKEAASELRTHPVTIMRWIRAGLLEARVPGRKQVYITRDSVQKRLANPWRPKRKPRTKGP